MDKDYGLEQHPITQIYKQPESVEEWRCYALSEDQIMHYKDYGFVKDIKILNKEQIEYLRDDLKKLTDPGNPGNEYFYEYHSNAPGADNYPPVDKGHAMRGTYYPLLMDKETEINQIKDVPTINMV